MMASSIQQASRLGSMEVKVDLMIKEIRQLILKRDGLSNKNADSGVLIQSEIFRKFALIDLIRFAFKNACHENLRMETLIANERLSAQATTSDLNRMQVNILKPIKFSRYIELPPEIREKILQNLTRLSDKHNVSMVLPREADLMPWNIAKLQSEMVLLTLVKQKVLDYDSLVAICQFSDDLKSSIMTYFKNSLKAGFANQFPEICLQNEAPLPQPDKLLDLTPIPGRICLQFNANSRLHRAGILRRRGPEPEIFQRLSNLGTFILDCKINIEGCSGDNTFEAVHKSLKFMPNLRRLQIVVSPRSGTQLYYAQMLPRISKLEFLEFVGDDKHGLINKLLETYEENLIGVKTSVNALTQFSSVNINFSNLTVLDLSEGFRGSDTNRIVSCLETFFEAEAPLKEIRIRGNHEVNNAVKFKAIMTAVNSFGGTLEKFFLHLSSDGVLYFVADELSWLGNMNFPKVKSLEIQYSAGTWPLLLAFPAFETLVLDYLYVSKPHEIVSVQDFLGFSWDVSKHKIQKWIIWKIMPFLERIELRRWVDGKKENVVIRRAECVALQRKLVTE